MWCPSDELEPEDRSLALPSGKIRDNSTTWSLNMSNATLPFSWKSCICGRRTWGYGLTGSQSMTGMSQYAQLSLPGQGSRRRPEKCLISATLGQLFHISPSLAQLSRIGVVRPTASREADHALACLRAHYRPLQAISLHTQTACGRVSSGAPIRTGWKWILLPLVEAPEHHQRHTGRWVQSRHSRTVTPKLPA